MSSTYTNLSISIKKEDRVYADMLHALSAYFISISESGELTSISGIIVDLIKAHIPEMVAQIERERGVNVLSLYYEYQDNKLTIEDFFEKKRRPNTTIRKLIDEKMKKHL